MDRLRPLPVAARGVVYETVAGRHVFDSLEARRSPRGVRSELAGGGAEDIFCVFAGAKGKGILRRAGKAIRLRRLFGL